MLFYICHFKLVISNLKFEINKFEMEKFNIEL